MAKHSAPVDPFGNDDSMASDQPHGAKPHLGDEDFMQEFMQPDDAFGTNDLVDDDDQIFTADELQNQELLDGTFRVVYTLLAQGLPSERRMRFLKDTHDYWSKPENNSWKTLAGLFDGEPELFDKAKDQILQLKTETSEGGTLNADNA